MIVPSSGWNEADYEEAKWWLPRYLGVAHAPPASHYYSPSWHARIIIHDRFYLPIRYKVNNYEARVEKIIGALTA